MKNYPKPFDDFFSSGFLSGDSGLLIEEILALEDGLVMAMMILGGIMSIFCSFWNQQRIFFALSLIDFFIFFTDDRIR